jgi:hypothetical protein
VQIPTDYLADGPMAASFGIGYLDGVHPSLVAKMKNRVGNGGFNLMVVAWDFNGNNITQKWKFTRGNANLPDGHQFRVVDVDQDGDDEFVDIGFALNGDGTLKYELASQGVVHGDRFHIGDLDPDRPGLEGYGVQQDNPSLLYEYYYDAATGQILHKHFGTAVGDVGRGIAADIDPSYRGYEYWSFSGIYNSRTPLAGQNHRRAQSPLAELPRVVGRRRAQREPEQHRDRQVEPGHAGLQPGDDAVPLRLAHRGVGRSAGLLRRHPRRLARGGHLRARRPPGASAL